jgi:hypothetical protein
MLSWHSHPRLALRIEGLVALVVLVWGQGSAWAATAPDGRWHPGIGDPTPMGWITVLAYAGTCLLCWACARRLRPSLFWWAVTLALLFLGINKQLDLQTWFTQVGRDMAMRDGWYAQRHDIQVAFIAAMGGLFAMSAALVAWALQGYWRTYLRVWSGMALLMFFIVVRAASFHHVDQLLMSDIGGMRMNWLFELGGLALIASGAWRANARAIKNPLA